MLHQARQGGEQQGRHTQPPPAAPQLAAAVAPADASCGGDRVAVIALGTRGDVQPLALLAWQLSVTGSQPPSVSLVTHGLHELWLADALPPRAAVRLLLVSSLPGSVWGSLQQQRGGGADEAATGDPADPAATRQELLQHCRTALGLGGRGRGGERQGSGWRDGGEHGGEGEGQEHGGEGEGEQQQQQQQRRLVVFNLFALEGYHLAEALGVPCAAAQPYLIPYGPPAGFGRRFARALPRLHAALEEAAADAADADAAAAGGPQHVSWRDVVHWMWPLFTERWGSWRQEALGLPPLPLEQAWLEGWAGCTHRGGAASRGLAEAVRPALPAAVPVLYGLSATATTRPGFWPRAVELTGAWLASDAHAEPVWWLQHHPQHGSPEGAQEGVHGNQRPQGRPGSGACGLPPPLQRFLDGGGDGGQEASTHPEEPPPPQSPQHHGQPSPQPQQRQRQRQQQQLELEHPPTGCRAGAGARRGGLLVVDFGSMGLLGLLRHPGLLVEVLVACLEALGWRGVLLTGSWAPLARAHGALRHGARWRLHLQPEPLACHHLLLAAADAVLHHGGSGTTAAALAAGTPQLVCPLQFDQFQWAETVAQLGCSPAASLSLEQLLPEPAPAALAPAPAAAVAACAARLAAAVQASQQAAVWESCGIIKQAMSQEQGLRTAAGHLAACLGGGG